MDIGEMAKRKIYDDANDEKFFFLFLNEIKKKIRFRW